MYNFKNDIFETTKCLVGLRSDMPLQHKQTVTRDLIDSYSKGSPEVKAALDIFCQTVFEGRNFTNLMQIMHNNKLV